jgi:hypothetical protein
MGSPRISTGEALMEDTGFPNWLFLASGTKSTVTALGAQASEGPLGPLFLHHAQRWDALHPPRGDLHASPEQNALNDLQRLVVAHVADCATLGVYERAIDELRGQYHVASSAGVDLPSVFVWIFDMYDDFFPLLRKAAQEAVAIFAHLCVLFKKADCCWLDGWADHLMSQVHGMLDDEHRRWISWPAAQIGGVSLLGSDPK